ncbi:MAG: hypothetical protein Q9195_000183 [Heterodermia aff. obscurata]
MPIGIERLNARHQQPNSRITFIKPLPGPDSKFAQDFLERIAAICHPIMKANHLSIMTLEEYEPNPEFVGRNFNAGEIIQLMNHSAAFWKVRNQYAGELRGLWSKDYTGDGFWGRGKTLLSEQYENIGPQVQEVMPRSLCGGTFRSRGRKRKRRADGPESKSLTYAERQQRRIAKKFGTNGVTLGDDEETRVKLEYGVKVKAKPKVAKSVRGRELRAAAALARFGQQKEEEIKKDEVSTENDSDTEDEYDATDAGQEALDFNGSRILDGQGNSMVKVCDDQDTNDTHVKQEMQELQDLETLPPSSQKVSKDAHCEASASSGPTSRNEDLQETSKHTVNGAQITSPGQGRSISSNRKVSDKELLPSEEVPKVATCPICTTDNDISAITCMSTSCSGTKFVNADDSALCSVCGARRRTDEH